MKNTTELDCEIAQRIAAKATLATDLESEQQKLEGRSHEKSAVRSAAIRHGDASAKKKLNEMRQGIAVAQMAIADITDEIAAIDRELDELQIARREAVRLEAWAEFVALGEECKVESMNLDELLAEFFRSLEPHATMLSKMNALMVRAGVSEKGFSLELFHRCVTERFRVGFSRFFGKQGRIFARGSIFEQKYADIIDQRIKGIQQRHDGTSLHCYEAPEQIPEAVNE